MLNDFGGGKSMISGVSGAITTGHHTRYDGGLGIDDSLGNSGGFGLSSGLDGMSNFDLIDSNINDMHFGDDIM